ncbi:MAG: twin-arginine translocase subunit TatC [candidate division WOR-3 bacterium]
MEESFLEHLEELRIRIIRVIIYLFIFTLTSFVFSLKIIDFIKKPIGEIYFFSPQEAFIVRLKVSLLSGIFFTIPFLIYELWAFIKPGLYENEIKNIKPFIILSPFLFYVGFFFSIFVIYPLGIKVLLSFAGNVMLPLMHISDIVNFLLYVTIFTGLLFELPILILILVKLNILDYKLLKSKRREVIVLIFILAALFTPSTDFITMSILAIPIVLLFELSIFFAKKLKK